MATSTSRAFSIRRCSGADAEMMAALGARLFTETYGPTHPEPELSRYLARSFAVNDMRAAIESDEVVMFTAEDPGSGPIGYAYLRASHDPPSGVEGSRVYEIVRFYVDTAHQGRGIGAALMAECLDEAKARAADTIWLQVWKEAPWAVGFYARMGFTVVGSAPFYFGDRIGDDHIMSRRVD